MKLVLKIRIYNYSITGYFSCSHYTIYKNECKNRMLVLCLDQVTKHLFTSNILIIKWLDY